jgi:hypothetical protein
LDFGSGRIVANAETDALPRALTHIALRIRMDINDPVVNNE